jgi:hypothetical protein
MINVICVIRRPLPIWSASQHTWWYLDPMLWWITGITFFPFQFRIRILTHSLVKHSCYRVLIRAQHPWCCWRVSHSQTTSTTAASNWILAATAFRWILVTTASSRLSRPELQHSSPHLRPGILAATAVGTSSWRASPAVRNASVDDTNAAVAATFYFTTNGKSFVLTFNCSIRNTSKYRTSRLLVHLCF